MIVVADSGPLHYLILLEQSNLLHSLYDQVVIPDAVADELRAAGAPRSVRDWLSRAPSWLRVIAVTAEDLASITDELDLGERAAIALVATTPFGEQTLGVLQLLRDHLQLSSDCATLPCCAGRMALLVEPAVTAGQDCLGGLRMARGAISASEATHCSLVGLNVTANP